MLVSPWRRYAGDMHTLSGDGSVDCLHLAVHIKTRMETSNVLQNTKTSTEAFDFLPQIARRA